MKTRIYRPTPVNLRRLGAMLNRGKLVAVPAETVYGLAGDATNPAACAKIFKAKGRPTYDPLIVHVATLSQAKDLAIWTPLADELAKAFWPGPLTLVLKRKPSVSDIITSGLDTVAVRMPSHPIFRELLKTAGIPLAAPSANPFGYISPTCAEHVRDGLDGLISAILDGGACDVGVESTILGLSGEKGVSLLRPGAVSRRQLREALGSKVKISRKKSSSDSDRKPIAPGLLDRHYSPKTPTILLQHFPSEMSSQDAWVHFDAGDHGGSLPENHFNLSPDGTGETAAKRLFSILRKIDRQGFRKIFLEQAPIHNEWAEVLNDRMARASAG